MISNSKLFETIYELACKENKELIQKFGKGIFFMPELAFSYLCGKSIMMEQSSIFGADDYTWVREKAFKNYGIADMVFESKSDNPETVIEFKMDDTYHNYLRDVEKLRGLEGNFKKYFCALKWEFADQTEKFLEVLLNELDSELIDHKVIKTIVNNSKLGDRCLLTLWEVNRNWL